MTEQTVENSNLFVNCPYVCVIMLRNPCAFFLLSSVQLWKSQNSDEKVLSVAIIDTELKSKAGDVPLQRSLLFAGLENGQIMLVHCNGRNEY